MKIIFENEIFEQQCRQQTIIGQDFLTEAFNFWLHDSENLRSPFPTYTHEPLIQNTFTRLMHWAFAQDANEVTEEKISQIFQAIITEEGSALVQTDDERLSIVYPEYPRIGDAASLPDKGKYKVVRRELSDRNDHLFLKLILQHDTTSALLETEFEV